MTVEDDRHLYAFRKGDKVTCERGHPQAEVMRDLRWGDLGWADVFWWFQPDHPVPGETAEVLSNRKCPHCGSPYVRHEGGMIRLHTSGWR